MNRITLLRTREKNSTGKTERCDWDRMMNRMNRTKNWSSRLWDWSKIEIGKKTRKGKCSAMKYVYVRSRGKLRARSRIRHHCSRIVDFWMPRWKIIMVYTIDWLLLATTRVQSARRETANEPEHGSSSFLLLFTRVARMLHTFSFSGSSLSFAEICVRSGGLDRETRSRRAESSLRDEITRFHEWSRVNDHSRSVRRVT